MPRDLQALILLLNAARLGSFGEAVFLQVARDKGWHIESQHSEKVDYRVEGELVDVKTSRQSLQRPVGRRQYSGPVPHVRYVLVEFVSSGASVSIDGAQLQSLNWEKLDTIWDEWTRQRGREDNILERDNTQRAISDFKRTAEPLGPYPVPGSSTKRAIADLKQELVRFLAEKGITTRIIYRTCMAGFKQESPHNLKPEKIEPNRITIYLDFRNEVISADNLNGVYAFPDTAAHTLPMLEKTRLHRPKVDVGKMPAKFVFRDLEELKRDWRRILD